MEKEKLPSELEINDLLKIVESAPKEEIHTKDLESYSNNLIYKFAIRFQLGDGEYKVPKRLVKALFCAWAKKNITQKQFTSHFLKYVPQDKLSGGHFYLNKTIQEVMKLEASEKKKTLDFTKIKPYQKLFKDFIKEHSLEKGKIYVEADILYYLFRNFCDKKRRNSFSYQRFTAFMSLHFEDKALGLGIIWYGFNDKILTHLPKELVDNWRQGRAKYGKREGIERKSHTEKYRGNTVTKAIYEETIQESQRKGEISST